MESHDEERIMYKNVTWGNTAGWSYSISDTSIALDRIRLVSAFFYTIPGPKMIWQFGELGYDYSIDYNGRLGEKPVRWDYYDDWRRNYNYNFISALIDLKTSLDVFETEDYELDVSQSMKRIMLYSDSMNVVIVGNFDVVTDEIQAGFNNTGPWYEYFSGDTLSVTDLNMSLELVAGEYRIYTDRQLATPDIGTGIEIDDEKVTNNIHASVFPNPVSADASLRIDLDERASIEISIYDLFGSELSVIEEYNYPAGSHLIELETVSLPPGIYFSVIRSGRFVQVVKFIKR